ncbi:MAG TPA: Fic family protein [Candidatus Nanoarchaeia archaeon]|nr:Fic family protein [Candidatus Nanoarchaeia archaeon]
MNGKTREHIDNFLLRINKHPEYSTGVYIETLMTIQEDAAHHSRALEITASKVPRYQTKPEKRKNVETILRAHEHLAKEGVSLSTLAVLGHIIEPQGQPYPNFRREEVTIGTVPPSAPEAIVYKMKELVNFLNTDQQPHPLIRAIEAHLVMAGVHPYIDGNGRAARALQNHCLQEEGYPPAIIPSAEREVYTKLLRDALSDRYRYKSSLEKTSRNEEIFHEFIAAKVLLSLEHLEGQLRKSRAYAITINRSTEVDPGMVYQLAKKIRSYGRSCGSEGVKVSIPRSSSLNKSKTLRVLGDIGKEQLERIVEKSLEFQKSGYIIECINDLG